jgi:2-polyprenyl-6-methoxyphenol hydroxylase-like FAD-dependent oxidoreductase
MTHKQPALEKHLRHAIDKDFGELREGCTLSAISEDDNFVHVHYQSPNETLHRIRGKFLVGADGKTGFTRKKYLEPRGVLMEKSSK